MALSKWANQAAANTKSITHKYGGVHGAISDGTSNPVVPVITMPGPSIGSQIVGGTKSLASSLGRVFQKSGNMVVEGNRMAYVDLPKLLFAIQKNDKKAIAKLTAEADARLKGSGTFGGGMAPNFKGVDQASKGFIDNPAKIADIAATGGEIASWMVGGGAVAGLKTAKLANAVTRIATNAGTMGAAGAIGTAGSTYQANPKIGMSELIHETATGGLYAGALGGVLGGGAGLVAKGMDKSVKNVGKSLWGSIEHTQAGAGLKEAGIRANELFGSRMARLKSDFKGLMDDQGRVINEELVNGNAKISTATAKGEEWLAKDPSYQKLVQHFKGTDANIVKQFSQEAANYRLKVIDAITNNKPIPAFTGSKEAGFIFKSINESKDRLVKLVHSKGLITDEQAKMWIGDADYIRVQRRMDDLLKKSYGTSGGLGSKSSSVFSQRLKGGKAEAIDALSAHTAWVREAFTDMAKNDFAVYVAKNLEKHGMANKLVDADRVLLRKSIRQFFADTKPGKKMEAQMVKKYSKEVRTIQKQLTILRAKGRTELARTLNKKIDEVGGKTTNLIDSKTGKLVGTSTKGTKDALMDPRAALADVLSADSKEIRKLKKMMGNRQPKLQAALDNLIEHKNTLEGLNITRKDAWDLARLNADATTRGKSIISNLNKGIKEVYEVDPRLANSIKNLGMQEMGWLYNAAMTPQRWLRASATAINPVFIFKNLVTDQINSAVASASIVKTHAPVNIVASLVNAGKATVGKGTVHSNRVSDDVMKQLLEINQSSIYVSLLRNETKVWDQVAKDLKLSNRGFATKTAGGYRKIEDVLGTTELSTRLQNGVGAYENAIKKGMTHEQALSKSLYASRVNSADFLDYGSWAKGMRLLNVYLPASVAGSRTILKAFAERPTATTAKVIGLLVAPTVLATYNNLSDPEKAALYASMPAYERENNFIWIFGYGGGMHTIKMPLPPGLKSFTKAPRNLVEAQYLDNRDSFLEMAKNMLVDPFNPLGTTAGEMIGGVLPQGIKQGVELKTNTKLYSGQQIIPDSLADKMPQDQVFSTTGTTFRDLGKLTGLSPVKVKYLFQSSVPGFGEATLGDLDMVRKVFDKKVIVDSRSTVGQFQSRFTADRGNNISDQFYNAYGKALKQQSSYSDKVTAAAQAGDLEKALSLANEANDKVNQELSQFEKVYYQYATSEEKAKFDKLKKGTYISTKSSALKARAKK